jgi:hypothetical protein
MCTILNKWWRKATSHHWRSGNSSFSCQANVEARLALFHPDLIRGTSLGRSMKQYGFFSYDVHEALHLSELEKQIVLECFRKIEFESST